jgi:hypothetical protein
MPTIAQVILGLLLLAGGLTGVLAAVLGNPIHVGGMAIPGPNGGPARTIVGGIGSAALAACAVVFIFAGAQGTPIAGSGFNPPLPATEARVQGRTGSNSGSVGGLPSLTPIGSPKPPAAPSTTPAVPGKPTVTSITVKAGTLSGCDRIYHAGVIVANGPVTITYVVSVNGHVVGPNPRTATVSGSTANLDDVVVDAAHPGEIVYNLLSPNRLSDLKTWTVPADCQPKLSVEAPYLSKDPGPSQPCANAVVEFEAKLHIIAPPKGMNVTYHAVVNGVTKPDHVGFFQGTTPIGERETLPDASTGKITVQFFVTAPVSASSDQAVLQATCTSPPPTSTPPASTSP